MNFGLIRILLILTLVIYLANYLIGFLLYYKKIKITKTFHQVIFTAIIIELVTLLFLFPLYSVSFVLCFLSFVMMIILPYGKKGGVYHRLVSTAGLLIYIVLYLQFWV